MSCITSIIDRAKKVHKKIVLPETMDERVIEASKRVIDEGIADVILIGDRDKIKVDKATIIDPNKDTELTNKLIDKLVEVRKNKGLTYDEAKDLLLNDYMYYACMLVKSGKADGVVSGACHSSSNTLRPALQIIKTKENVDLVSAFFLMEVPDCELGYHGTFIFADAGLEQNPDASKLASIAGSSAESFKLLTGVDPVVAMLSHSTKGSAKHNDVNKVVKATEIAKKKYKNYLIDGELQVDAAIVPEIAKIKAPDSKVAGHANVLIFPDLDAGNIGYKLVERLGKAKAYGPITQGIAAPVNDLSRGCSIEDIVGAVAITVIQTNN